MTLFLHIYHSSPSFQYHIFSHFEYYGEESIQCLNNMWDRLRGHACFIQAFIFCFSQVLFALLLGGQSIQLSLAAVALWICYAENYLVSANLFSLVKEIRLKHGILLSLSSSFSHRCSHGKNKFFLNKLNLTYYDLNYNSNNFSSIIVIAEILWVYGA